MHHWLINSLVEEVNTLYHKIEKHPLLYVPLGRIKDNICQICTYLCLSYEAHTKGNSQPHAGQQ